MSLSRLLDSEPGHGGCLRQGLSSRPASPSFSQQIPSVSHLLKSMSVGDRRYYEVPLEAKASFLARLVPAKSRRSKEIRDWTFKTTLLTAIEAGSFGAPTRYLVCLERVA